MFTHCISAELPYGARESSEKSMPNLPQSYRPFGSPDQTSKAKAKLWHEMYGRRWQQARKRFLADHPLCVACEKDGKVEVATVVDHKIPHRGNYDRFWDETNWAPMCKPHHDAKTRRGE